VVDQHIGTDRGVPDAERPDHLLVQLLPGEDLARVAGSLRLPQIALEELAGARQHLQEAVVGESGYAPLIRDFVRRQ
jgi:hypothetical protein